MTIQQASRQNAEHAGLTAANVETGAVKTNRARRPYTSPRLTVYGDLAVLTQGGGGTDVDGDGGSAPV